MYDLEETILNRHSTRLFLRDEPTFPANNLDIPRSPLEANVTVLSD